MFDHQFGKLTLDESVNPMDTDAMRRAMRKHMANIDRNVAQINLRWTTPSQSGRLDFSDQSVMTQVDFIVGYCMHNVLASCFLPPPCISMCMSPRARAEVTSIMITEFLESMKEIRQLAVRGFEGEAARLLGERIGPAQRRAAMPIRASLYPEIIVNDLPWGFRRLIEDSYRTAGAVLEGRVGGEKPRGSEEEQQRRSEQRGGESLGEELRRSEQRGGVQRRSEQRGGESLGGELL